MTIVTPIRRSLGTMIVYGYPKVTLTAELTLARRLGATLLEILPDWKMEPDPGELARQVADQGLAIHSAHGCWGGQTIRARQVDLASLDPTIRAASVADLIACIEWLATAGGSFLVVHPGGLAEPGDFQARRATLIDSLGRLAATATSVGVLICVENMPPGVYPGSNMADLTAVVTELASPAVALALDTGHAFLQRDRNGQPLGDPSLATSTRAAGRWLATTHVHDNNGQQDLHWPPGLGGIDWEGWVGHLDAIDYRGPIVLECIRHLRQHPDQVNEVLRERLGRLTGLDRS